MTLSQIPEIAPPDAAAMVEALRGVGYSLATSIADIVDNSVAAGARNVWIDFRWEGRDSWIRVADDGEGMTAAELFHAMRLGARNPLDARPENDLGRFGLGLKTASFSQCRRMTVASRKAISIAVRRWDLDHIAAVRDWHLLADAAPDSEKRLRPARDGKGTVVLWEVLDRVPGVFGLSAKLGPWDPFLSGLRLSATPLARSMSSQLTILSGKSMYTKRLSRPSAQAPSLIWQKALSR
jgi:hypothetical protein